MFYRTRQLLVSTALVALMLHTAPSFGDTMTSKKTVTETPAGTTTKQSVTTESSGTTRTETNWKTEERSIPATGSRIINFLDFDMNKDTILSINEIGEMLFKLYDTDGNNVIDNIEYDRRAVVTILPVEKNTVISYDFDGDGKADETKYTYETFMQDTLLTRFDMNRDGLSPREFTDLHFMAADVNNDKVVDLKEWQGSYIPSLDRKNKKEALFNK